MARADPQFNVRMPDKIKKALAERAKSNGRSMNSEIVQILEDALFGKHSPEHPLGDHLRRAIDKAIDDVLKDY
ncbi:TPA: Arc family DNA-binding protein [Salmonella enterica subsp. enterica serovar Oranienburg]|uniref:Arc family DNA-binding protein n=1 Tax=Salmonella enterica TaxID=28901 RepID=UPI0012879F9A|nr:Arc family DNA-binding protein [Salmonella enterica]EBM9864057.1 Arc family DNA-binding protein [Salmonella enterica subsp. enterica serovar Virchow]EAV3109822.1 Arc family DNA-binding protein [Salmonella enterica]EDB5861484.1 Arc family DNA-binding protein [Salmonella enterica subsp. enterica serovar Virchow]EDF8881937.1 Arc family DNA-binding protein [Salmonella enterica]EID2340238.1 Arc family DNA-binding protein [Salmonella enterica]